MKTYIPYNTFKLSSFLVGCILLVSGCKKDKVDWYRPIGNPLNSNVKFINTLPASKMDFYTYTTKITSGIGYGDTTIPYVKTPFGNIIVYGTNFSNTSYRVTGATNGANPQMGGQGLVADYYQTMFTCKTTDSTSAETMILLRDNLSAPASGKAHIRFVHLAQRGTTQTKELDLVASSGPQMGAIFTKLRFQVPSNAVRLISADTKKPESTGFNTPGLGVYTSGPFTPIDAGSYSFDVKKAGTEEIITTKKISLSSGKIYTFYTIGTIEGAGSAAVALKVVSH